MVRASTIVVTALALVPVLAVPVTEGSEDIVTRSIVEENADLEARKFKFGKAFKKFKGIAKIATKFAAPGAGALLGRDIEGEVDLEIRAPTVHLAPQPQYPRDLDLEDGADLEARTPTLQTRDFEDGDELEARSPGASPPPHHETRDLSLEDGAELEARTPLSPTNFARPKSLKRPNTRGGKGARRPSTGSRKGGKGIGKRGKGGKKGKGGKGGKKGKGLKAHGRRLGAGVRRGASRRIGAHPRSFDDFEDEVLTRELDTESMLNELLERGIVEVTDFDLETREPKFKLRLGKFLKKAVNVAGSVARVGAQLALREEDEMEVRSDYEILDELD